MTKFMTKFHIIWMFFTCTAMKGCLAIYCVQCSSLEDPLCSSGDVIPTRCPPSTVACLTYVGKMPIPGMDVVIRDCAQLDMGTFCQQVPSSQTTFAHEFCVDTCYYRSCNNLNRLPAPAARGKSYRTADRLSEYPDPARLQLEV